MKNENFTLIIAMTAIIAAALCMNSCFYTLASRDCLESTKDIRCLDLK